MVLAVVIGVVAFKMPTKSIAALMSNNSGMGASGETFLAMAGARSEASKPGSFRTRAVFVKPEFGPTGERCPGREG